MNTPTAWNDNARWGRFTREFIEGITAYRCGVCLKSYPDPYEKSEHLRDVHHAEVRMVPGDLYEWSRS